MAFDPGKSLLKWWIYVSGNWREALPPSVRLRLLTGLALVGLAVYAFLLRCLHLFSHNHYFLVGLDSHYFHWLAGRVMASEGPPNPPGVSDTYTLHSGFAYPLAYIAKAIGSVFNLSSAEALDLTCKIVPPLLSLVSMFVIYFAASRIYNRRVGLLSSLAWAGIVHAIFHGGAAGHVDRDALNLLLLTTGALLFYFSRGWQFRVGGRDVGWLVAALGVLVIELMLYLEWSSMGPFILLAVLVAYSVVRFVVAYADVPKSRSRTMDRLTTAARQVNWRVLSVIIGLNLVVMAGFHSMVAPGFNLAVGALRSGGSNVISEMQGIWARGFVDLVNYHFFLIPMALGLYLASKRRDEGSIFFSTWFVLLLFLSLFSGRILMFAAPAACVLSGVALAFLWDWGGWSWFKPMLKKVGVVALFLGVMLWPLVAASLIGSAPRSAVHEDWEEGLGYLRDNTSEDAVVMTWWDYGYWILDVAQRRPVVDNGYYGWDLQNTGDIRTAYLTTEASEAVQIMEKYGAGYLIFSKLDEDIAPSIIAWPEIPEPVDGEWESFDENSLVARSLNGEFETEGGLEVVYRNSGVVILELNQSGQP